MQPDLRRIRRDLSLRVGVFVAAVLLAFALAVDAVVSHARRQLQRRQLQQLAATAAAELPLLRHEHEERDHAGPAGEGHHGAEGHHGDNARPGALDFPLAGGRLSAESVEADQRILWFNAQLELLQEAGEYRPAVAELPPSSARERSQWLPLGDGLALWQPVPLRRAEAGAPRVLGYVAVALADQASARELGRLRRGLLIGGLVASVVAFAGGRRLVAASLEPTRRQVDQLIRFTADASHELRHPLTAIRAQIGSLRHRGALQGLPPAVAGTLAQIDQTSDRMARLLDDLLLLSRSDRTLADAPPQATFPLEELVDDLIQLHHSEAEAAGVRLVSAIEGPLPLPVRGRPERLWRLLENLLANALRFSPPAGIVSVGLARQGRMAQLWVDDQGPGIPPDQRRLAFERFWQADASRSGADHHGLGLAIADAIAREHGGRLQVLDAPGGGCRLLLELPLLS